MKCLEKRSMERFAASSSILCGRFKTSAVIESYGGKMLNYSPGGMCISSSADFKKGAIVLVRVQDSGENAKGKGIQEGFRSISLVEIKWVKPTDKDGSSLYGMKNI